MQRKAESLRRRGIGSIIGSKFVPNARRTCKMLLARTLGKTQQAISHRLKLLGMFQKQGNWVRYELTPRNVERRFSTFEMLLVRHKRNGFLHRIVTGDEKWIHYDNPKRKTSWGPPGHA